VNAATAHTVRAGAGSFSSISAISSVEYACPSNFFLDPRLSPVQRIGSTDRADLPRAIEDFRQQRFDSQVGPVRQRRAQRHQERLRVCRCEIPNRCAGDVAVLPMMMPNIPVALECRRLEVEFPRHLQTLLKMREVSLLDELGERHRAVKLRSLFAVHLPQDIVRKGPDMGRDSVGVVYWRQNFGNTNALGFAILDPVFVVADQPDPITLSYVAARGPFVAAASSGHPQPHILPTIGLRYPNRTGSVCRLVLRESGWGTAAGAFLLSRPGSATRRVVAS
jgi:hypothetical protein